MRAFIFGAGASLHVGYPLARNLGRGLVDWAARSARPQYLYWIDPAEVRTIFDRHSLEDFEGIITELENPTHGSRVSALPDWKRGSVLAGFRNALCDFFDSIRSSNAPLYHRFAAEVAQPGDIVITFNYDVSLEHELRLAGKWEVKDGYGFDLGIASLQPSVIKILKLHGSTNWIDLLFDGAMADSQADALGPRPVILPQEFKFLEYQGISDPRFKGGGVDRSGSMILPGRLKRFDTREGFWNALWTQAAATLRKADEVFVIGYSLPEADERARELVKEINRNSNLLTLCSGCDNSQLQQELRRADARTDLKFFHDLIGALENRARGESGGTAASTETRLHDLSSGTQSLS